MFPVPAWPTGTRLLLSLHKEWDTVKIVNACPPYREKAGNMALHSMASAVDGCPVTLCPLQAIMRTRVLTCVCVHACALSSVRLCETPWTVASQAPLSMGFSRQEYWSGWPFPPPGDLPDPGTEPTSPVSPSLAGGFFTLHCSQNPPLNLASPAPFTSFTPAL